MGFVEIELARFLQMISIRLEPLIFLIPLCLFAIKTRVKLLYRWRSRFPVVSVDTLGLDENFDNFEENGPKKVGGREKVHEIIGGVVL